jgi:hypothetical protein
MLVCDQIRFKRMFNLYHVFVILGTTTLSLSGTINPAAANLGTAGSLFANYVNGVAVAVAAQAPTDASANTLINAGYLFVLI